VLVQGRPDEKALDLPARSRFGEGGAKHPIDLIQPFINPAKPPFSVSMKVTSNFQNGRNSKALEAGLSIPVWRFFFKATFSGISSAAPSILRILKFYLAALSFPLFPWDRDLVSRARSFRWIDDEELWLPIDYLNLDRGGNHRINLTVFVELDLSLRQVNRGLF